MSCSSYKRGIAAVALAGGCFSVPPYQPEGGVSYTAAGAGAIVTGPRFELRFADDDFHFPDALMIDGADAMAHDSVRGCAQEEGVGFLLSPTPRISAHSGAEAVTNVLAPVLVGPAVVKVKLDWSTRFSCNATRKPGGTSIFTVFPDGKIMRHDRLADTSSSELSASQCACDGLGVDFTVSSFWTLARNPFTAIYRSDQPGPQPVPDSTDDAIENNDLVCADAGTHQVTFAWDESVGTAVRGSDQLLSFGFEFLYRNSRLDAFDWTRRSALFIGHDSCAAAVERAEQLITPATLTINGNAVMPSERDGIYGGEGNDGQTGIDLALANDRAEVTGMVSSSFAVWVRFDRPVDALRVTRDGAKVSYLPQQVDASSWIVWFPEPLLDQTLAIEPR